MSRMFEAPVAAGRRAAAGHVPQILARHFAAKAALACGVVVVSTAFGPAGSAGAAWEAPVEIAPSSQPVSGGGTQAASVGLYEGNALVGYRATEQAVAVRRRDSASASYTSAQTLAEATGSDKLTSTAAAVGPHGEALAAWSLEKTKTAEEHVSCATRASGASSFSPCASNLLGPPGLFEGNWRMGDLQAASGGSTFALTFEGPGGSSGYAFSRPFGVYGSYAGTPSTTALTGNIGLEESGRENRPVVAINSSGDAVAVWTGWPTNQREVVLDYHDHAGSGWAANGHSGERIYCCSFMGAGDYRAAVDGPGNGYVLLHGGSGGGAGAEGIIFAYESRSFALGGTGPWGVQQQLDTSGERPRIAVDSDGDATAIWVDKDAETGHDAVFVAYRPAGAETKFSSAVEATVAPASGDITGDEVYVSPSGNVVIAWMTCAEAACSKHEVRARTRVAGGGAFGPIETVEAKESSMGGLALAGDPQGEVLLGWSEGGANALFASAYTPPPPSEGGGAPSSTPTGVTGSSGGMETSGSGSLTLTLHGSPTATAQGASFSVSCIGAAGNRCDVSGDLTATERIKGKTVIAVGARRHHRATRRRVSIGSTVVVVAAGEQVTIDVPLNATGRKLLARFHKLPVTLTVTITNGIGGSDRPSVVATRKLVIRTAKKRKHHHYK